MAFREQDRGPVESGQLDRDAEAPAQEGPLGTLIGRFGVAGARTIIRHKRAGQRANGSSPTTAQAAARGVDGGSGALPHLSQIQKSFGRHDVSGIEAHTDDAAREGAAAMGAQAFAAGNHVAFAGAPDLHTAAHEAAHVVQQRAGVSKKGGVGEEGDAHERHADAVADRVVAGASAEALLDQPPPDSAGGDQGAVVQRKITVGGRPFGAPDVTKLKNSLGATDKKTKLEGMHADKLKSYDFASADDIKPFLDGDADRVRITNVVDEKGDKKRAEAAEKAQKEAAAAADAAVVVAAYLEKHGEETDATKLKALRKQLKSDLELTKLLAKDDRGRRFLARLVAGMGENFSDQAGKKWATFALKEAYGVQATNFSRGALKRMWAMFSGASVENAVPQGQLKGQTLIRQGRTVGHSGVYKANAYDKHDISLKYNGPALGATSYSKGFNSTNVKKDQSLAPTNAFDSLVLHEMGHAVDADAAIMLNHKGATEFGGWEQYESPDLAKSAINAEPSADKKKKDAAYKWGNSDNRWGDRSGIDQHQINGHIYYRSYDKEGKSAAKWVRYNVQARQYSVSDYQWRAPAEWFAEQYAAYFLGKLPQGFPFYTWFVQNIATKPDRSPHGIRAPGAASGAGGGQGPAAGVAGDGAQQQAAAQPAPEAQAGAHPIAAAAGQQQPGAQAQQQAGADVQAQPDAAQSAAQHPVAAAASGHAAQEHAAAEHGAGAEGAEGAAEPAGQAAHDDAGEE